MSAHRGGNRRRRGGSEEHENSERWLLTYADMITLLMALFIVMWSISAVNTGKFNELKLSLKEAFSGKIFPNNSAVLTGEQGILQPQGAPVTPSITESPKSIAPKILDSSTAQAVVDRQAQQDLENLKALQQKIEQYAVKHGLASKIRTSIDERGLVVRVLTDQLLFDSGEAVVKPASYPLLGTISHLLARSDIPNDIQVQGNTDDRPIATNAFRSNWELSTARATAVLEVLLADGIAPGRLAVAGYADQRPIAPNTTAAGRSLNRRVEIVVLRRTVSEGSS